jgi:hypothetical protein
MILHSEFAELDVVQALRAAFLGASLLWAQAVALGCAAEPIVDTQVIVVAETNACEADRAAMERINAYKVTVIEFTPTMSGEADLAPCYRCLTPGSGCREVETKCWCAEPRVPTTVTINSQLDGLRFESMEQGKAYCLGLVGYSLPGVSPPDGQSAAECDCDPRMASGGTLKLCGISPFPTTVGENAPAAIISADCRDRCPIAAVGVGP